MKPADLSPNEVVKLGEEQISLAREYSRYRELAYTAKRKLDILLTANLKDIRERKSNAGYEMSILMLMETSPDAVEYYSDWIKYQARYKGLEKIIEAVRSQISLHQSIWKLD